MGNVNEQKKDEITFIQRLQDRTFGPIDIFQNTQGVYLMQVHKNFSKDDLNHKTIRQITQYALVSKNSHIIPIVSIKTDDHHGFCGIFSTFTLITEYYNFTLHDMIRNKKIFDEGQLWLIFESLLLLILDLKNNNFSMKIEGSRVFLTLKGKPAVSHLHIQSNQNSLTFHFATMGQQLAKLLIQLILGRQISEEDLQESKNQINKYLKAVQQKYSKMHVFIRALLSKEKKQRDVYIQINQLFNSGKITKANQIKLTKFKYLIPENMPGRQQKEDKKDKTANNIVINAQFITSVNQENLLLNSTKQRKRTEYYEDKSEANKQYNSSSEFFLSDKTSQMNIASYRLQSSKLLGEFERKKEEYKMQKQKFELKRDELLTESEKQNFQFSRPSVRDYDSKKNKNKTKNHQLKRISTQVSKNSRCR